MPITSPRSTSELYAALTPYCCPRFTSVAVNARTHEVCSLLRSPNGRLIRPARTITASSLNNAPAQNSREIH